MRIYKYMYVCMYVCVYVIICMCIAPPKDSKRPPSTLDYCTTFTVWFLFFFLVVHSFPYGHAHLISIHMEGGVVHLHINLYLCTYQSIPIYIYIDICIDLCFDLFSITCALLAHLTQFVMQIL